MRKSMRICLAIVAASVLALGTTGCSSALRLLSEDPKDIARQAVGELLGGRKQESSQAEPENEDSAGTEAFMTENSEGDGERQSREKPSEAEDSSGGADSGSGTETSGSRIVTEEQFLKEYADRCLQQERSLYDYHEKNYMIYREPGAWQTLGFSDTGMLEDMGYDGLISTSIYDFDEDGHQELLMLRLVQNPVKEGNDWIRTDMEASMYEIEGEQVILADRRLLFEGMSIWMNAFRMDAFVKNTTYGVRLFCETDGNSFILADGHFWYLRALEYADGRFWELADESFSGSSWEPESVLPFVNKVRILGLHVTDLLKLEGDSPGILEQDDRTCGLASVRRQVNLNYAEYGNHRFQPGETMEYGFTEIRNQAEGQETLHLPAPEAEEIEPLHEESAVRASQGDYIVPESSSRLLTDEEIARIPKDQLQMAINEVYARNGRRFQNPEIQSYFDGKSWYHGTVDPKNFSEDQLSKVERENIKKMVKTLNR